MFFNECMDIDNIDIDDIDNIDIDDIDNIDIDDIDEVIKQENRRQRHWNPRPYGKYTPKQERGNMEITKTRAPPVKNQVLQQGRERIYHESWRRT